MKLVVNNWPSTVLHIFIDEPDNYVQWISNTDQLQTRLKLVWIGCGKLSLFFFIIGKRTLQLLKTQSHRLTIAPIPVDVEF